MVELKYERRTSLNKYIYLKEPGILYDMMFALKLRFNGERAFSGLDDNTPLSTSAEEPYRQVIKKLDDVSDKLLPLFYWNESPKIKTGLLAYMRMNMYRLHYTEPGLIDEFYDSLRDVQKLKKFIYKNYVSENCPDVIDTTTFGQIKEDLLNSALPAEVKMYMTNFLLYSEDEIEFIISELKKAQSICEELHEISIKKIDELIEKFDDEKINTLSKIHMWDIKRFHPIYQTYCALNIFSVYGESYNKDCILYLRIDSDDMICRLTNNNVNIDLYELGRILYDETRLKILNMLKEKPMYCAEIARELGLKNNSTLYHLAMMEKQSLLREIPKGKKIFYYININYLKKLKKQIYDIELEINDYENK